MKIRPFGVECLRADGQTDMTKLIVAFRNFAVTRIIIFTAWHNTACHYNKQGQIILFRNVIAGADDSCSTYVNTVVPIRSKIFHIKAFSTYQQRPVEIWWHTRRNHFSSFGETDDSISIVWGRQFSRLLAAEMCPSAVLMLDTSCSDVVWRIQANHSIRPVYPSLPLPCITVRHNISTRLYRSLSAQRLPECTVSRVQLKCEGTRWRMWWERKGIWRMQWVASTLHTTSEYGVSNITTADAHNSAASSRVNWRSPANIIGLVCFADRRIWFLRVCHHISNAIYKTIGFIANVSTFNKSP